MENEDIAKVVKKLEPYFHGYKAEGTTLANQRGLTFRFYSSWNDKTTISGIGGSATHSIGCSFSKSAEKIAKDIRRRLLPEYREDFFTARKREQDIKKEEKKEMDKLKALAVSSHGRVREHFYSNRNSRYNSYVDSGKLEIYQDYSHNFVHSLTLNFSESLKLIEFLKKEGILVKNKEKGKNENK